VPLAICVTVFTSVGLFYVSVRLVDMTVSAGVCLVNMCGLVDDTDSLQVCCPVDDTAYRCVV